jgi:hypothetical protein
MAGLWLGSFVPIHKHLAKRRLKDCKAARGLQDKQAPQSANQKGWREFLASYSNAPVVAGERAAGVQATAALPVLPPISIGALGGDTGLKGTEASQGYRRKWFRSVPGSINLVGEMEKYI